MSPCSVMVFQSTRPVRGATEAFTGTFHQPNDFNPRAPCGARHVGTVAVKTSAEFQSTRPVRGATVPQRRPAKRGAISIHAPRAGRDVVAYNAVYFSLSISIHAPRAGRDGRRRRIKPAAAHFNPRAPCGARRAPERTEVILAKFQSTRPVRGATFGDTIHAHGGRISIHAPRAGRDRGGGDGFADPALDFNPRAPCGARLVHVLPGPAVHHISIHAPRAGRDRLKFGHLEFHMISIHAPRAGRDAAMSAAARPAV